jgi:glycosyltransferase involved in cell wall biosynthesis
VIPLFVDLDREWRGGQSQALLLLKGLYERGHAAELLTVRGSLLAKRARQEGIYVHTISGTMRRLRAAAKIRALLADGRFELVHVNEAHALSAAWLAGAHKRLPLLSSRRIGFPLRKNWISKSRFRALARLVANSEQVAKSLIDAGIPAESISVVNEGVEIPPLPSRDERKAARKKWQIADGEFLFGCASAFVPEKGQRHLVEALGAIRENFPDARLLLAGEGKSLPEIKELVERLDLRNVVLLPGFQTHMRDFYAALDAFVFPSEFEGLGTALQAAMAYALPVISTVRGALGEVVEDGRTAIVAEPNAEQFAAAMERLLLDSRLRKELGEAGREVVKQRFSADLMVENTLRVYEEVLQST